jgi:hypothetical protein
MIAKGGGPPKPADYVVLGEAPFSIRRFRSTTLADRGGEDNVNVATYESDTRMAVQAGHQHLPL